MRIEEANEESLLELTSLRISSLDNDEEAANVGDNMIDIDEDEDLDEDEYDEVPVTLGFVEKPENSWSLLRQLFPSKAGGVPAWLDPHNLPSGKTCLCDICGEPLQFLLQVYAPVPGKDSTFHRTLFVFMCPSMSCLLRDQHEQWKRGPEKPSRSVKVFRCQLPRANAFYACEPPKYNGSDRPLNVRAPPCTWCGTWRGDKVCGSCRKARYCSEKHQANHWRAGHKLECQKLSAAINSADVSSIDNWALSNESPKVARKSLWPEYKIIEEFESDFLLSDDDVKTSSLVPMQQPDESVKSMMESFKGDDDKKSWATFQVRLARAPEQVLRYSRHEKAGPLWPTSSGRPSRVDIPKCSCCGGAMAFEFQILPQLLYYFGVKNEVDSLDWATIVVYTCVDSCEGDVPYIQEFAWVQLTSQSPTGA